MLHGRKSWLRLTSSERAAMRTACAFNAQVMDYLRPAIRPGVSTQEIDVLVHEYTSSMDTFPRRLVTRAIPRVVAPASMM